MTNFLLYKLKQFWIRRYMWRWCFDWWFRVMYPHIYYSEYGERYEEYMSVDDMWWFWKETKRPVKRLWRNGYTHRSVRDGNGHNMLC